MPKTANFAATRKAAEDAGMIGGGGDYYKYKEGDNRIRLLTECLPYASEFKGQRNFKWVCYVLDRRDGKIKTHFMPHRVYKAIEALQVSEDYAFDEVPMPYDLTVQAKGAGTKEVEYTVVPARANKPLTDAEERELYKQKSIDEVVQALKDKQKQTAPPADEPPAQDHDDEGPIPF